MKRLSIAALVAALTLAGFLAMAASLGGVTSTSLGADTTAIASCDTDGITTSYTVVYDATDARHEVSEVIVGGVDVACNGQNMTVTLTNAAGTSLDTTTVVAATGSNTVATTTAPDAELVTNVHVVITG